MLPRASFLFALCALLAPAVARAQADPFAPVAARVERHADADALAAFDRVPLALRRSPRGRYLRGRILERLGRIREAAEAYPFGDATASFPDVARADSRRRRAIALSRSGRCAEARAMLEPDRRDALIEARLAECALALGDLDHAVPELRAVVRRAAREVDLFAARFALAEALLRTDARDEAVELLTELVVERVEHPESDRAMEALLALSDGEVALSFDQRARRADRLMDVRRYDDAISELEALGRPEARADLRRYLHLYGMALYGQRHRYEDAAPILTESARMGGASAADDQFHAARALSRADRDPEAIRAYRAFARAHASHRLAPEATYLAAWLEIRHGVRGGERQMRRFLASGLAARAPSLAREATWQLALGAFERGRHREAAQLFLRYSTMSDDILVRARGLYWLGRAKQAARDRRGAIAAYRDTLYVEPLHWYAMLARQRLEELGQDTPPPFPDPPDTEAPPATTISLPEEVTFYAALGLRADARDALREHEPTLRREGGLEAVVAAYQRLDEPSRLVRLVGGNATTRRRQQPGPADRWRWDAAYPHPWAERTRVAATAVGLEDAHLYAVMRQESGFDPDVVSYADAIGLMQLLPATADRVAARLGITVRREALFDPSINIRLGASYVGGLAERFGIPLAFSGFNAGGHRVQQWLEEQGRTELDLFVERIPYEQTRNYTRRVTTHLAHYLYLRDPSAGWPLGLPTHVAPTELADPDP
jgi:soluble lytic murein transglycosylase